MVSNGKDLAWHGARNATATVACDDSCYSMHCVANALVNAILAVCQLGAMICHIICFSVLMSKINEIEDKIGPAPSGEEVCILYLGTHEGKNDKGETINILEYNGGHTCDFVIFGSITLAILAALMMICLIVRIVLVRKMNCIGIIDVVEIIVAGLLSFAVSVVVSIGRTVTCSSFTGSEGHDTCADVYLYAENGPQVEIYGALKSTEITSWVAFLFLVVVAVVAILRIIVWFYNWWKNRKSNVSAGLIANEEKPSVDEVHKTLAAM